MPVFLAGFLFILTEPDGYVVTRLLHFVADFTARTHDLRATFWTLGRCSSRASRSNG
jgi:glutathione S-transferase